MKIYMEMHVRYVAVESLYVAWLDILLVPQSFCACISKHVHICMQMVCIKARGGNTW